MSLSFLAVLGAVALWLIVRGNIGIREAKIRKALEDPDATTLDELARAGSILKREHLIEFYLYLPNEAAAQETADELRREGFGTEVSRNEKEKDWTLLASRRMRPELAPLRAMRDRLTAMVVARGGSYDGWGTEVEDDDEPD